ncbi:MAG: tripartite tricarboxylate transporter substrate binding protein [Xanthobacteraceae bacterium]
MISKRGFLSTIAMGVAVAGLDLLGLAGQSPAVAQAYPSRAIHIILPFPGGPTDLVTRLYAQRASQDWHEPAVVDTRPGATGSIGTEAVVQAKPDGYTLLFTVDLPITMAPNLLKVPYDPQRDLIPIAGVVESNDVLIVNAASGIKTLAELVAAAKAKPGALTFSSAGVGSPGHLCGEMIEHDAGVEMIHVPYKGAGPSLNALLAGNVTMACVPVAQALPFIRAAKVTALGVAGSKPSPLLPEVTPLSATYPGLVMTEWFGLFAPAHTSAAVCDKLAAEYKKIYGDPELQKKLTTIGLEPTWIAGPELSRKIKVDLKKWHDLMAAAGIHAS